MPRIKFFKKSKKGVSSRKRSKSLKTVPKSVKSYVSRAITRKAELKMTTQVGTTTATCATVGILSGAIADISPFLFQGVGASQRIGNKVTIQKVMMRYVVSLNYSTVSGNPTYNIPFEARMFIGHTLDSPYTIPSPTDLTYLFKFGNSAVGFNQTLFSLMRPINKDYWSIPKQKRFKVGTAQGPPDGIVGAATFNNNDFKSFHMGSMDITSCYKKSAIFNDNVTGSAWNQGTYLFIGCCDQAGSTFTYAAPCVQLTYEVDIMYTDE